MNTIKANKMMIGEPLSGKAKAIFQYLAYRSNSAHKCWPGLNKIAADCSFSVSTVQRALRELLDGGYIRKKHNYRSNGSQTSNIYELIETMVGRAEVAVENAKQRLSDAVKKLEQIRENQKQHRINLPIAAVKPEGNSAKRRWWDFFCWGVVKWTTPELR